MVDCFKGASLAYHPACYERSTRAHDQNSAMMARDEKPAPPCYVGACMEQSSAENPPEGLLYILA